MRRYAPFGLAALAVAAVSAEAHAQAPTITVDLGGGVRLELVLVPAGKFRQGSPPGEPGRGTDEAERDVTISKPFYMGKLPVTRGQFERFVAETGYRTEAEKGSSGGFGWDGKQLVQKQEFNWRNPGFPQTADHPVTIVTFDDAKAFTRWLSQKARREVDLPTEAQWEHACRAGTKTRFCGAADERQLPDYAWFKTNAGNGTRPAGSKKPNAWGLVDMSGGVWEWCRDWYGPYPAGAATDPEQTRQDLSDKPRRVLRGGSWLKDATGLRAAARYRNTPGSRNADNGFRVVASIEEGAPPPAPAGTTPTTTPTTPPSEGDDGAVAALLVGGLGLLAGLGCFGGFVALIVFLIVRSSRSAKAAGSSNVRTWAQGDGFFVQAANLARGSRIHYRCNVAGQVRRGTIEHEPSPRGQFVYTGGYPTNVVIEGVDAPAPTGWANAGAPRARRWDEHDYDSPPPFRGYPSAY